jgi:hypothetical protein
MNDISYVPQNSRKYFKVIISINITLSRPKLTEFKTRQNKQQKIDSTDS